MDVVNLNEFITKFVTKRDKSFFKKDLECYHDTLYKEINGSSVLVIGGSGTIGSNYIKTLLKYSPSKIVVVDTNENGLTELVRDIRSSNNLKAPNQFITYPVNLGDPIFEKIYNHYKPFDIVANFAAHKHVRSEKDLFSIEAMIQNNLFNAYTLLELIAKDKPAHFFCVSTDKAANPVNIMGATKKLMEELVMEYSKNIKCTSARFANVAFSNGSLLDGYTNRILKHQPLSFPEDIMRYFISPKESGEICTIASIIGKSEDIFFPKLLKNQLIGFHDITEHYLAELGFTMEVCLTEIEAKEKAQFIDKTKKYPVLSNCSNTSGEKLFEEFYTDNEVVDWDSYYSLAVTKFINNNVDKNCGVLIKELKALFAQNELDKEDIVKYLTDKIKTFDYIEKSLTLDLLM